MTGAVNVDQADEVAVLRAALAQLQALLIEQAGADAIVIELCRQLCADAYVRGWRVGHQAGYLRAVADFKRAQHEAVDDLDLELTRWHVCCGSCRRTGHRNGCTRCNARTRTAFGMAHPDDFTGLEVT